MMNYPSNFEFDDLQALLRFGHGRLRDSCFLLLNIVDADAAGKWLDTAPVSSAKTTNTAPDKALQIAFSVDGLRALGVRESIIAGFSDEFIVGMTGDESRSRRLGDIGDNAPQEWCWGGDAKHSPHILLLLYAVTDGIDAWRSHIENAQFLQAFEVFRDLPTLDIGAIEPFGFLDGISQPKIDWAQQQSTDLHERDRYSNWLAAGEVVLGYANEYGEYTSRPLIEPQEDELAAELPNAEELPSHKDFGRNGSYVVIRQLQQDVPGLWKFLDKTSDSAQQRDQLAASMVGRQRDGSPLIPPSNAEIPGISLQNPGNQFTYDSDPDGHLCPLGAHVRRANPRTGDYPPGVTGFFSRIVRLLGFGLSRPSEDLVASTRFHRLLRRGRSYGELLSVDEAIETPASEGEHGLQFICLVANISRQFEFVQNAWAMSSKFNGVHEESDPLLGNREPLASGIGTHKFNRPDPSGPMQTTSELPQFVNVRGGGYFFMPGLRALKYIASLPGRDKRGKDKLS